MSKGRTELPLADASREASAIVGSGIGNMNPTLVRVVVTEIAAGSSLFVRAVAKEGAVPQKSAALAVERFLATLGRNLPGHSLRMQ
jgi:hypothetical protein